MFKVKKVNDIQVKPLSIPSIDICKIKGKDMFETLFPNILLVARKNSGKTTVLYNILNQCINKHTKVFIFCSTVFKDPSYEEIVKLLNDIGADYELFTEVIENKVNYLSQIVNELKVKQSGGLFDSDEEIEPEKQIKFIMFDDEKEKKTKRKKKTILTPKYVFIFDDISEDLRSPALAYLLKKNRHFGIMNIISTQSYKDITPPAWRQIDYALLFKNLDENTIEDIKTKLSLTTNIETFKKIYEQAVQGDYNFLFIEKNKPEYRQNFCSKFEI